MISILDFMQMKRHLNFLLTNRIIESQKGRAMNKRSTRLSIDSLAVFLLDAKLCFVSSNARFTVLIDEQDCLSDCQMITICPCAIVCV